MIIIELELHINLNREYYAEMTETYKEPRRQDFSWANLTGATVLEMMSLPGAKVSLSDDAQQIYISADGEYSVFIIVWLNDMTYEKRHQPINGMDDLISYLLGQ